MAKIKEEQMSEPHNDNGMPRKASEDERASDQSSERRKWARAKRAADISRTK